MNEKTRNCPARDELATVAMLERQLQQERERRERVEKEKHLEACMSAFLTLALEIFVIRIFINAGGVAAEAAKSYGIFFAGIGASLFGASMLAAVIFTFIQIFKKKAE